jgi:hypothetical protein
MRAHDFFRTILAGVAVFFLMTPPPRAVAQTPAAVSSQAAVKAPPGKLPASDKFTTVAAATAHCPGDTVVWSSFSKSQVYHLAASKYYGKTKHGAYVCEKDADAFGYHASKR